MINLDNRKLAVQNLFYVFIAWLVNIFIKLYLKKKTIVSTTMIFYYGNYMVLANYNGDVGQIFSIQVEGNTNAIC